MYNIIRESRYIYRVTGVCLSRQMLGMSEISALFCFGLVFVFFKVTESPGDEVTLRGDFRTRKSPRSSAGLLPYVCTRCSAAQFALHILLSLETPRTKTKPCDPLSVLWSLKSQWFLTAGVLQLRAKYDFRGNSTSSLEKKAKQPLPLPPP